MENIFCFVLVWFLFFYSSACLVSRTDKLPLLEGAFPGGGWGVPESSGQAFHFLLIKSLVSLMVGTSVPLLPGYSSLASDGGLERSLCSLDGDREGSLLFRPEEKEPQSM